MSREALLDQLRLDRAPTPPLRSRGFRGRSLLVGVTLVSMAVLAGAAAWLFFARGPLPIHTVLARDVRSGGSGDSVLDASGYVVARRQATVASKVTGRIVEVDIEEGQTVSSGQVIARLDPANADAAIRQASVETQAAQAAANLADVDVAQSRPRLQRSAALHDQGLVSDQGIEDAKAAYERATRSAELASRRVAVSQAAEAVARQALTDTVIRAPFAGVVTNKAAQPGEVVSPVSAGGGFTRTGIGTIVDMDSLEVDVDVAESFIKRVKPGMAVDVKLNAYPDWQIPGEVIAVVPTADRSKATVSVRVGLKSKDGRIVPEMGAHVSFLEAASAPSTAASQGVLAPRGAILTPSPGVAYVFRLEGGRASRTPVRVTGVRGGDLVVEGITPGEQVILAPPATLQNGDRVRLVSEAAPGI